MYFSLKQTATSLSFAQNFLWKNAKKNATQVSDRERASVTGDARATRPSHVTHAIHACTRPLVLSSSPLISGQTRDYLHSFT